MVCYLSFFTAFAFLIVPTFKHFSIISAAAVSLSGNDLTKQNYLQCYFDKQLAATASVYSLGSAGRKYLKQNTAELSINPELLDRTRREKSLSLEFRNHCLFLADIQLSLLSLTARTKALLHFYTKSDLSGFDYLIAPLPDLYFSIEEANGSINRYFLDVIDDGAPKVMRARVQRYVQYYKSDDWQGNTDKPFPSIIMVCPSHRLMNHLKYYIQRRTEEDPGPTFFLTTRELVKENGICKEVLEKVEVEE